VSEADLAFRLWSYLSTHPLAAITATLAAYLAGDAIWRASGKLPVLNPVLIAIILLSGALTFSGVGYAQYFDGAQFVHVMLGPATVALAVPLWSARSPPRCRRSGSPGPLAPRKPCSPRSRRNR
jgi:putative effector of murein hydrolase